MMTIAGMRPVTDSDKLQGQSLPEIRRAWKQVTLDLSTDPEIREATRGALRDGNLLNAFVIWCCLQSPARRKEIAEFGLRALEFLKDHDEEVELRGQTVDDFGQRMGKSDQPDRDVHPTKRGRSKVAAEKRGHSTKAG